MFKLFAKIIWNFFAVIGVLTIIISVLCVNQLFKSYHLTPRQFAAKALKKAEIESPMIEKILSPPDRFADYNFQGQLKSDHPRILFKDKSQVEAVRQRYRLDADYKKMVDSLTHGASAWLCSKNYEKGQKAVNALLSSYLASPDVNENYGNGLDLALQYDFLYDHPDWSDDSRAKIEILLRQNLKELLLLLDGDSASLWHGRFQLACSAWVIASVLDISSGESQNLVRKAQAHFLEAVGAIRTTEGWPEGYNYWINNRAYPYALACLSHINSVDAPELNQIIRDSSETTGMWTIYGTEPGGRFVQFGDSGPRNDLKDETQRVIDLIYLCTRNSVFRNYSAYIEHLHGSEGYYSGYRWSKPVFRGLPELDFNIESKLDDLSVFNGLLDLSRRFGPCTFDQVFIRSGWSKDDTFIYYRAGDTFTHHGHYQAGHFSITKYSPLAIKSGNYSGYTLPHRLNYYIRTVSSNSILIMKPDERVQPNHFFKDNVSEGGQRIIIPTGSAVTSLENYKDNFDKKACFEGASITTFDNSDSKFVYINSDLTKAYSSEKAFNVQRELCYLIQEDLLIVHDLIETKNKDYTAKWLLHLWNKPVTLTEKVLKGKENNGILETYNKDAESTYKDGKLFISAALPKNVILRKIGGIDYRYYVETDGDDSDLDGENMVTGAIEQPWFDSGLWRIEFKSPEKDVKNEFLVLLKPDKKDSNKTPQYKLINTSSVSGIQYKDKVLIFLKDKSIKNFNYSVIPDNNLQHIIMGTPFAYSVEIIVDKKRVKWNITDKGTIKFETSLSKKENVTIEIQI